MRCERSPRAACDRRSAAPSIAGRDRALAGCDSAKRQGSRVAGRSSQADARGGLFDSVADNLDQLEAVRRQPDAAADLRSAQSVVPAGEAEGRPGSPIRWWPSCPTSCAALPVIKTAGLRCSTGCPTPGTCRSRSGCATFRSTARGDQFEDLAVAERLFDWTVRNIQLEPDADPPRRKPVGIARSKSLLVRPRPGASSGPGSSCCWRGSRGSTSCCWASSR